MPITAAPATHPGPPSWPPTYQGRLRALADQIEALRAILGPLQAAARAFQVLGGLHPLDTRDEVSHRWTMPLGGVLVVRAGYSLRTDVAEIARGVIPPPDPVVCLASALCSPELWEEAMGAFRQATEWAAQQAAEYGVSASE